MIHSIDVPPDYMSTRRHLIPPELTAAASLFERAKAKLHSDSIDGTPLSPTDKKSVRPPRTPQFLWSDLFARRVVGKMQAERDKLLRSEQAMLGGAAYHDNRRALSLQHSETIDTIGDEALRYVAPTPAHKSSTVSTQSSGDRPLTINWIDQFIQANSQSHCTYEYAYSRNAVKPRLIVRRAQLFKIEICFNRRTNYERDAVTMLWSHGTGATVANATKIKVDLPLLDKDEMTIVGEWKFKLLETRSDGFIVGVTTATTASIGLWSCNIITRRMMRDEADLEHECSMIDIFLLANPANAGDALHLPQSVGNLVDLLYGESVQVVHNVRNTPAHWALGQHEMGVLEAVLTILARFQKAGVLREVDMVETLAYAVCTHVLPNESQFDYETAETQSTGSASILLDCAKYDTSVPCRSHWQRVTVLATALRALGIPCRAVTAFNYAQSNNAFVDFFFDCNSAKMTNEKTASNLWPMRVWLEVWLNDTSAPEWHAIDLACCDVRMLTAVNVPAIRNRSHRYARVFNNALDSTSRLWLVDRDGNERLIASMRNAVQVLTQGSNGVLDRTSEYCLQQKNDDGAVHKANNDWSISIGTIQCAFGESVPIDINCTNHSKEQVIIQLSTRVQRTSQDGQALDKIDSSVRSIPLQPQSSMIVKESVSARDYCHMLDSQATMLVSVFATQQDDGTRVDADLAFISLVQPSIDIQLSERPCVGDTLLVKLSIVNPLPLTMHQCRFHVEGSALTEPLELPASDTPSRGIAQVSFHCTPSLAGERTFVVAYASREMESARAALTVNVKEA